MVEISIRTRSSTQVLVVCLLVYALAAWCDTKSLFAQVVKSPDSPAKVPPPTSGLPAERTATRMPVDHFLTDQNELVTSDLTHGSGLVMVTVRRTWRGAETLNTHFGRGWSDENVVRLTLPEPERVLIWRGGIGWRAAQQQQDGTFVTAENETIRKTPVGWSLEDASGIVFNFDADGRLLSETSSVGPKRTYGYDEQGRLITVGDDPLNTLRYQYDGERVRRIEGPEGLVVEFQYDEKWQLVEATSARKVKVEYRYDDAGELVSAGDSLGNRLTIPVEKSVPPAQVTESAVSLDALLLLPRPSFKFDNRGRVIEQQEDGWITKYAYDDASRAKTIQTPEGNTALEYDRYGRVVTVVHSDARMTRFQYNNLDLPVVIMAPDGSRQKLSYSPQGLLTRREQSPRVWEEFEYDSAGRFSMLRQAPAYEERYSYDDQDRISGVRFSSGAEVRYTYGESGAELTETWSSGEWSRTTYDDRGRKQRTENSAGRETAYQYDGEGRLASISDNVSGKFTYSYTHSDTQYAVDHDGVGRTSFESTPWDRPIAITSPSGQKTSFQYNPRGRPLEVTSQFSWRYKYDPADRLVGIETPAGFKTSLARDAHGRVAAITRGGIVWRRYAYDARGRLLTESSPTGIAAANQYGPDGEVAETQLPDGPVTFSQDPDGTTTTIQGPDYQVVEQVHPSGDLARRLYLPAQLDLQLPLDNQGRPAGIELNEVKVGYEYNNRGQLDNIRLPSGTAIQIHFDAGGRPVRLAFGETFESIVSYDNESRITTIQATDAKGGDPIFTERYAYGSAGNLASIEGGSLPVGRMVYDAGNQLVKFSRGSAVQTFAYDVGGNLKATGTDKKQSNWILDSLGRPTARDQLAYAWDASGNLAKTEGPASKIENTFDAAGRLTRRQVGNLDWQYGYLPDGDRLWQQGAAGRTWYMYQPEGLAGYKDVDGVTWLLVTLPGTDWPLALCSSSGETYFVVADRLNSLRRLIDTEGNIAGRAEYGPFGNRESAEGLRMIGIFAGMVRDDSGLFYARQRYYDPHLARFISMDSEFGSMDLPASHNVYTYAANNPYRFRDSAGSSPNWAEAMPKIAARKGAFKPPRFPATEIRSGLQIMQHPEAAQLLGKESQEALARISRSLERNQRILQNKFVSDAARQRAQQAIERMANEVGQIAKEFKGNNLAKVAQGLPPRPGGGTPTSQLAPKALEPGRSTTQKVAQASQQTAGDAAEAAAKNSAREAAEKAAEQAAREAEVGFGRRWGGRLLRGAGTILEIMTIIELTEKNIDATRTLLASNEEIALRREGNASRERLKELVRIKLADPKEHDRIIPRDDTGKPDSIDALVGKIDNNIINGRRPLDGVLTDAGKTVPAAAQQGLQAALNAARGEITRGRVVELAIRKAQTSAAQHETTAQVKATTAAAMAREKLPNYERMKLLPAVAQGVQSLTEKAQADAKGFQAATQAMLDAAEEAQNNANTICGYAAQSKKASDEDVKKWQAESLTLLQQSTTKLQAAQQKIDKVNFSSSAELLRAAISQLQGYKDSAGDLASGAGDMLADAGIAKRTVSENLAGANKDWQEAVRQRQPIAGWRTELAGHQAKVKAVLSPYDWSSDIIPLMAQADALGNGLSAAGDGGAPIGQLLADAAQAVAPLLALTAGVETGLSSIDVGELLSQAEQAATDAETAANEQGAASFASASTSFRPIIQAKKCYDEIKASSKSAGLPANPPAASPTDESKFPNIRGQWSCNHGSMWNITQNGNVIGGSVQYPDGGNASIGGKIDGQKMELGWRDNTKASGAVVLYFKGNNPQSMTGKWIYNQTDQQKQNGEPATKTADEVLSRSGNK